MAGWLTSAVAAPIQLDEAAGSLGPRPDGPDLFDNALTATGESLMKGGALAAQTLMLAGSIAPRAVDALAGDDNMTGKSLTHRWFETFDDTVTDAVNYWTPDERTTGAAGRVLGGIAEFAVPMMLSGGNPMAMASLTSAQATATSGAALVRDGVDAGPAGGVAAVQGLANLVGAGVATRGATALRRAAFGAGANVAVNMPADAASAAILDGTAAADRYDPLNVEARTIDLVVGALFGVMSRPDAPPPRTADLDAALTLQQVKHAQYDTAPGKLETPADARAHMAALTDTQQKLLAGEALDGTEGRGVEVRPDPAREQQAESVRAAVDAEVAALRATEFADEPLPMKKNAGEPAASPGALFEASRGDTGTDVLRRAGQQVPADGSVPPDATTGKDGAGPAVDPLRQAVDQNPDMPVALVDDPDAPEGARRLTARDALDEVEAEGRAADELSRGYEAAINCFLRGGS